MNIIRCIRKLLFVRYAKKKKNLVYQKQGLVMKWTSFDEGSVDGYNTIITPEERSADMDIAQYSRTRHRRVCLTGGEGIRER